LFLATFKNPTDNVTISGYLDAIYVADGEVRQNKKII
jgi:hypothetical protein